MLDSFNTTCKKIEGTHETQKIMRHELCGYRVAFGRPILVTWSPSERHNMLMIRLSRVRDSDPLSRSAAGHALGGIDSPELLKSHLKLARPRTSSEGRSARHWTSEKNYSQEH